MTNYFDKNGNYINAENLSLAEIYHRAATEGYKKGFIDGSVGKWKQNIRAKTEKPIPDEAKQLIEEERLLDERDGTIAGRGKE